MANLCNPCNPWTVKKNTVDKNSSGWLIRAICVIRGQKKRIIRGQRPFNFSLESMIRFHSVAEKELLTVKIVEQFEILTDRVVNSLWAEMSKEKRVNIQDMYRVIESDFVPQYNPFVDYLERLPPWQEGDEDYILRLARTVTVKGGSDEQERFVRYLRKWLVGMIAAWLKPDVVNNVIFVLIGPQGSYKTTWFNYILPPELRRYFYTKSNSQRMNKDDLIALTQYALVCCEELDAMRTAEQNQLKAVVTMTTVDERAAYARYAEHREHIASFCGTGNNQQFLSDPTGNRRWLPFEVESILSPRDHPLPYEGIYSQAYALLNGGFQYWFPPEEVREVNSHNRRFETPRLENELIEVYFRKPSGSEHGQFMTTARIMERISGALTQKLSPVNVGRAMVELGFEKRFHKHTRGFIVIPRTAEEMQNLQVRMAMETGTDDTDGTDVF